MGFINKQQIMAVFLTLFATSKSFAAYPFLIYYGYGAKKERIERYETVVLESENYKDVRDFKVLTLAYLSIGEVENFRNYYPRVASMGLLGETNQHWPASRYVSLKSGEWQKITLEELIPKIIEKGYKGVFLDTVDSLIISKNDISDIVSFINSIKQRYPELYVMVNRGFDVLDLLEVDAVLFESTITTVDFKSKKYFYQPDFTRPVSSSIVVYSCDYWDENDTKEIKKIYKKALEKKYIPIVTDFSLQKLPKVNYDKNKKSFSIYRHSF